MSRSIPHSKKHLRMYGVTFSAFFALTTLASCQSVAARIVPKPEIRNPRLNVGVNSAQVSTTSFGDAGKSRLETALEIPTDIDNSVTNAKAYGAKGDGLTDDFRALQAAIDNCNGTLVIPTGVYLVSEPLQLKKDIKIVGSGGAFKTCLKPINDNSVIKFHQRNGATTRSWLQGITFYGRNNNTDQSPLIELENFYICYFQDLYFWRGNRAVHISGGDSPGNATSALSFNNCLFQYFDDYAVKNEGQYSLYFTNCNFERNRAGTDTGGSRVWVTKGTSGRLFNKTVLSQCHFEESIVDIDAEGVSIKDSYLYYTNVILRERSQNCQILDNTSVPIGGSVTDLGYGNQISGLWSNTLSGGISSFRTISNVLQENGTFRGVPGSEFLFHAVKTPFQAQFTGSIQYTSSNGSPLYQTEEFTTKVDPVDPLTAAKAPKDSYSNYQCLRVGIDGGLRVANADVLKAKINLLSNGTFHNGAATGWGVIAGTSVVPDADTSFTRIANTAGKWGLHQTIQTVPGRRYMVLAQTKDSPGGVICLGSAWDGTKGARQASGSAVRLGNGDWISALYFDAQSSQQRISIGNYLPGGVSVRWIAAVDLDDNVTYGVAPPTTGTWATGTYVRALSPTEEGSTGSKYLVHGWTCVTGGTPGTWVAMQVGTGN